MDGKTILEVVMEAAYEAKMDEATLRKLETLVAEEELENAPIVPHIRTLRRASELTQEEFSRRYGIPLGTLRDWEQGRVEPDQAARSYLTVIARDPETVHRLLSNNPPAQRSEVAVP